MKFIAKIRGFVAFGAVAATCIAGGAAVFAAPAAPNWIGGVDVATITSDNEVGVVSQCRNQDIDIVATNRRWDEPFTYNVNTCVVEGDDIDVALYYSAHLGRYGTAVRVNGDQYFRHLATGTVRVSYAAEGDTLLYSDSYYGTQMSVVRNLSKNIIPRDFDSENRVTVYAVKLEAQEALLERREQPGAFHSVYSSAISENGRFVLAYVNYAGYVRIDLETGEEKAVYTAQGAWYNGMYNPESLAISNDGRYVLSGPDVKVIDTRNCGWQFDGNFGYWLPNCDIEYFGSRVADTVGYGFRPSVGRFIDDGYAFEIEVAPFPAGTKINHGDGLTKRVTVKAGNYVAPTPRLEYLALGDSYSSGEGDTGKTINGTSYYSVDTLSGCHLSSRAYPYLLRDKWGLEGMASIACSGALISKDYNVPLQGYRGQHDELVNAKDRTVAIQEAYDNYIPGRIPQLEFVKQFKPKVVTLTGSGNDVGFASILNYCASDVLESFFNYTCEYIEGGVLHEILNDSIDSQYERIKKLIEDIKTSSPGVKVSYIGYPSFIAGSNSTCALNNGALDDKERDMINNAVNRLNGVIRKAAEVTGARYVDIENALHGGRLCEGSQYMTGVWDVGIFNSEGRVQSFHPNAKGHQKIADKIYDAVANPMTDVVSPQPEVIAVRPGISTYASRIVKDPTVKEGETLEIRLDEATTKGKSTVFVTAFSEPIRLGEYISNSGGSISMSIKLPSSLRKGTHLLLLDITNPEGIKERVYQFIAVIDDESGQNDAKNRLAPAVMDSKGSQLSSDISASSALAGRHVLLANGSSLGKSYSSSNTESALGSGVKSLQPSSPQYVWYIFIAGILILGLLGGILLYVKRSKI